MSGNNAARGGGGVGSGWYLEDPLRPSLHELEVGGHGMPYLPVEYIFVCTNAKIFN